MFGKRLGHSCSRMAGPNQRGPDSRMGIMQLAYLEMLRPSMIAMMLVVVAATVGVFALTGPMGTYEALTPGQRLAYGALYAFIGWPFGYSSSVVTFYFMRARSVLEIALALTLVSLFAAIPCAAVVHTIETLAHPDYSATAGLLRLYILVVTAALVNVLLYLYLVYQRVKHASALATVTATGAAPETTQDDEVVTQGVRARLPDKPGISAAGTETGAVDATQRAQLGAPPDTDGGAGDRAPDELPSQSNDTQGHVTTEVPFAAVRADGLQQLTRNRGRAMQHDRFLELLPPELGNDVVYLKSEDHYVHVCTSAGSGLIKTRLVDAVAALGDAGIQVHRSYWVALGHVQELTRRDRKMLLRLSGNYEAPVSARYLPAVRAALKLASPRVG